MMTALLAAVAFCAGWAMSVRNARMWRDRCGTLEAHRQRDHEYATALLEQSEERLHAEAGGHAAALMREKALRADLDALKKVAP